MATNTKTKEQIPTLIDNDLHSQAMQLEATRTAIKSLKEKESDLIDQIKAKASDVEGGKVLVRYQEHLLGSSLNTMPTYQIALTQGSNSTIKREKLLERDVAPDIVDYATSRSTYTQVRIKAQDGKGNNDNA